jgi:hypothetical protein
MGQTYLSSFLLSRKEKSLTRRDPTCRVILMMEEVPMMPKIINLGSICGATRYRLEGGTIAPGWNPRGPVWCEFTLGADGCIYSFGGEVWPLAWPSLFESTGTKEWPQGTAQSPARTRLTAVGRVAFGLL